jgi:hypothetical protein
MPKDRVAEQASISDSIRAAWRIVGVQIGTRLADCKRETGARREHTVNLPPFQQKGRGPMQATPKRQLIDEVEDSIMAEVE